MSTRGVGRRLDLSDTPTYRGDPALRLVGRDEKPARTHAPQPPKPPAQPITFARLCADVTHRLAVLEPFANEYARLLEIHNRLEAIK